MRYAALSLVALLALAAPAVAEDDALCPFDIGDALALADEQIEAMGAERGVALPSRTGRPPAEFVGAVGDYLSYGQSGGADERSGLLFYATDGEAVCVTFARTAEDTQAIELPGGGLMTGDVAFTMVRLPLAPTELSALIDERMTRLAETGATLARAPRPRVVPVPHEPMSRGATGFGRRPAVDADALLADIANALLPAEFAAELKELTALSIVPALNIGRVPFAALDPDGDGEPLMARTAVNIEASVLGVLETTIYQWHTEVPRAPLVVGDPDATADPDWELPRLPGAAVEAGRVAALWQVAALTDADATPARVLAGLPSADYVHIAAHGIASAENPIDGSFLALTGGRLTARQIQHLELGGHPVVVLSACQSGLGGPLEAGIIGVARAFVIAGAIQVVASLWNVEDEATAFVMERYAALLLEASPAEALRRAQMEARERWASPGISAAFISFGPRIVLLP
jgi:hypothetical protein